MDLVEVIGKKNRKVPVLLTPLMKRGIDLLISTRDSSGVEKSNIFVFAKVRFFLTSSLKYFAVGQK